MAWTMVRSGNRTWASDCQSWELFTGFLLKKLLQGSCAVVYTPASFWKRFEVLLNADMCRRSLVVCCMNIALCVLCVCVCY